MLLLISLFLVGEYIYIWITVSFIIVSISLFERCGQCRSTIRPFGFHHYDSSGNVVCDDCVNRINKNANEQHPGNAGDGIH